MAITKSFLENKRYVHASTSSTETFVVGAEAVRVSLGNKINGDKIAIEGFATDYRVRISGNTVTLQGLEENSSGKLVVVQTITFMLNRSESATLEFLDGSLRLARAADGKTTLGVQAVGKSAVKISGDNMLAPTSVDEVSEAVNGPPAPPAPTPTYALTADTATANEGRTVYFTLNTTGVATGTQLVYTLSGVNAADILGGSVSGTITIGSTGRVIIPITIREDATTEGAESLTMTVGGQSSSIAITDSSTTPPPAAQTVVLNTEPEAKVAGAGDDVFRGTDKTLLLDKLDGDAHINGDTLIYNDTTGAVNINALGLEMTGVEIVEARSIGAIAANVSGFTGVTTLNATFGGAATLVAADSANINVASGVTGAIGVNGGKNIAVSSATDNQAITIGNTTAATGTIAVTSTKQGTGNIAVDGGTTVSVTTTIAATTAAVAGGDVTVGANTAATGAVNVVQNLTSNGGDADADDLTAANIAATGGTSINVRVNATSTARDESADGDIAIGTVAATASTATTSISAVQAATETTFTKAAVAVVKETTVVTFSAMTNGQTLIMNGLTFTAAKDLTAAQVAAAFSNIAEGGRVGGAGAGDGVYTGQFNTAVWSSAAANGATVTFTAQDENEADLVFTGTATAPTQVKTAGIAAVAKDDSGNDITYGAVTINDNATAASLTSITVDGYATGSTIGGTNATTKLATLNLANAGADVSMVVADTAATLALSLNKMGTSTDNDEAVVTLTAAPTTLNITNTGDNYVDLTAAATTTLSVAGSGTLNIADVDLAALETVTVSGSAGLILSGSESNTLTSVNTAATTGAVTATINGTAATYTGGNGVDTVTLATGTALTKAIDLGAGNDKLSFSALSVTGSTAVLSGGTGTDTLAMSVAAADALDGTTQTFYTNFERLELNDAAGDTDVTAETVTLDLEKLGFVDYVTTNGTADADANSDTLVLDNLRSGATVAIVAAAAAADTKITANIKNATTGTADVLNVLFSTNANTNFGTLTANKVETVNITVDDLDNDAGFDDETLALAADSLTRLTIANANDVVVSGTDSLLDKTTLSLSVTGATALATVDASAMLGDFTYTADDGTTVVTGGAGNDALTASGSGDTLVGGAGNDTLTGADLSVLRGGLGNDTFVINAPSTMNAYSTIEGIAAGDVIDTAAAAFQSSKVTLAGTAVFQDYANAAAAATSAAAWFQFGGDTFLVVDAGAASTAFVNGTDQIIKIAGLVDLSTAAFNGDTGNITIL